LKALDAAVRARQWNKAVQIVDVVDNSELAKQYYGKIAEHYASIGEYDVSHAIWLRVIELFFKRAERFYIEANMQQDAVDMYNRAGKWNDAHRVCQNLISLFYFV
jgi:intraflagellar transport protein 172